MAGRRPQYLLRQANPGFVAPPGKGVSSPQASTPLRGSADAMASQCERGKHRWCKWRVFDKGFVLASSSSGPKSPATTVPADMPEEMLRTPEKKLVPAEVDFAPQANSSVVRQTLQDLPWRAAGRGGSSRIDAAAELAGTSPGETASVAGGGGWWQAGGLLPASPERTLPPGSPILLQHMLAGAYHRRCHG